MFILKQNLENILCNNLHRLQMRLFLFGYSLCWNIVLFCFPFIVIKIVFEKESKQWSFSCFRKRWFTSLQIQWRENVVMVTIKSMCNVLMTHISHSFLSESTIYWVTKRMIPWLHISLQCCHTYVFLNLFL